MTLVLSPTACYGVSPNCKNLAIMWKGVVFFNFDIDKFNVTCDLSNYFLSLIKINTKTNIEAYSSPQRSKKGYQRDVRFLKAYFRLLEPQMGSDFRFYVLFLISDKKTKSVIHHEALNLFISKIKNFYPLFTVLPDFAKLGIASKRMVGEK